MGKLRTLLAVGLTILLVGGLFAPSALAAKKKKASKGPLVVGTDPDNDWGANSDPTLQPLGNMLGMEMTEAVIGMNKDGKSVDFVIKLKSLPPTGGFPEIPRYTWDFTVDGEGLQLDGKFTNFSRGVCDPTAGCLTAGGQPKNPGLQPFFLRGKCGVTPLVAVNFTTCEELGTFAGVFDAAAATITISVPLEAMKAKPGSKVGPGQGTFGGSISAAPAAWGTLSSFPMDTMILDKTFQVPK